MLEWLYLELFGGPRQSLLPALLPPNPSLGGGEGLDLGWDGIMWAVPKKRTSYTRKRVRNAPKYLKPKLNYITCADCKNLKLLHVLCGYCLKETMRKTAEMRTTELQAKLQLLTEQAKKE